jgi:Ni/Co efflux regulator RcnB
MRKILISLLLAGAAASPALAGSFNGFDPQNDNHQQVRDNHEQARADRQAARDERQSARDERAQAREQLRGERGGNPNGGQFEGYARPERVNVPQQSYAGGGAGGDRYYGRPERGNFTGRYQGYQGNRGYQGNYVAPGPRVVTPDSRFAGRRDQVDGRDFRRGAPVVSNVPRPGTQPPLRVEGQQVRDFNWDRSWRNDNRYDWRRYRDHHRSRFHLGLYIDPFGWGYEPFSIGWRLWPSYYGNQYWIDPGMYELPYPPPGTVWVRYWNDALLVDTYTGTVIDVIPGFFW